MAIFGYLDIHSKSIFSTHRQKFKKCSKGFLEKVVRNIGLGFELYDFSGLRRVAVLKVNILQNPIF